MENNEFLQKKRKHTEKQPRGKMTAEKQLTEEKKRTINVKAICEYYEGKRDGVKMKWVPRPKYYDDYDTSYHINFNEGRVYCQYGHAVGAFLLKRNNKNYCIMLDPYEMSDAINDVSKDLHYSEHTSKLDLEKDITFICLTDGLQYDGENCITYALKLTEMFARDDAKIAKSLVDYYEENKNAFKSDVERVEVYDEDQTTGGYKTTEVEIPVYNLPITPSEELWGLPKHGGEEARKPTELFKNWEYASEIGKLSQSTTFHDALKDENVFYMAEQEGKKEKTRKKIKMAEYTEKFRKEDGRRNKPYIGRINKFAEKYIEISEPHIKSETNEADLWNYK